MVTYPETSSSSANAPDCGPSSRRSDSTPNQRSRACSSYTTQDSTFLTRTQWLPDAPNYRQHRHRQDGDGD